MSNSRTESLFGTTPRGYVVKNSLVAVVYFVSAKYGLSLSVAQGNITPVWVPTGIALAALLLWGWRMWPGVALGAFVANVTTPIPMWVAGAIAIGNTLEAVAGRFLITVASSFNRSLETINDVLRFVVAALIATCVSATIGTTALLVADQVSASGYASGWRLWWFGDVIGALLITPLLLSWSSRNQLEFLQRRSLFTEFFVLATLSALASAFAFSGDEWRYPSLLFPLFVWAALRFRQQGATLITFIVSVVAVIGTVQGSIALEGATQTESLQTLQALISVIAVTTLLLASALATREKAEALERSLSEARIREREALHFNDSVVQGLAAAKLALDLGDERQGIELLERTLTDAKKIVTRLLDQAQRHGGARPGDLRHPGPSQADT